MVRILAHEIQQGESTAGIAGRFATPTKEVVDHPDNAALLENTDPAVLPPGEPMTVPSPEFQTGRIHNVVVQRFGELKLVLTDVLARPLKDQACRLVIGEATQELTTDSEGVLTARAPLRSERAKLFIGEEEEPLELLLGHLEPVSLVTGLQGRLNNLGYNCGEVDGDFGPRTQAALSDFQRAEDLEATGEADDDTRSKLVERHLS